MEYVYSLLYISPRNFQMSSHPLWVSRNPSSFSNTDSPGYQHRNGCHFVRARGQSPQGHGTQTLIRSKTQIHSIFTTPNRKEHSITHQCPISFPNSFLIPILASKVFLLSGRDRGKDTMVYFQYLSSLHLDLQLLSLEVQELAVFVADNFPKSPNHSKVWTQEEKSIQVDFSSLLSHTDISL